MGSIYIPSRRAPLVVRLVQGTAKTLTVITVGCTLAAVPFALLWLAVRTIRAAWGG